MENITIVDEVIYWATMGNEVPYFRPVRLPCEGGKDQGV